MDIVEPLVTLVSITPHSEKLIETAGRTCYKSENLITRDSSEAFIEKIVRSGHESVLEHARATFRIRTQRYTTHQIVRHRLFSYSQESQRYCDYSSEKHSNGVQFICPMSMKNPTLRRIWEESCRDAEQQYLDLLENGASPQEARSVLPSSTKTEIVMTGNFRLWRDFIKLRWSTHAQADVQFIARSVYSALMAHAPSVFKDLTEDKRK